MSSDGSVQGPTVVLRRQLTSSAIGKSILFPQPRASGCAIAPSAREPTNTALIVTQSVAAPRYPTRTPNLRLAPARGTLDETSDLVVRSDGGGVAKHSAHDGPTSESPRGALLRAVDGDIPAIALRLRDMVLLFLDRNSSIH